MCSSDLNSAQIYKQSINGKAEEVLTWLISLTKAPTCDLKADREERGYTRHLLTLRLTLCEEGDATISNTNTTNHTHGWAEGHLTYSIGQYTSTHTHMQHLPAGWNMLWVGVRHCPPSIVYPISILGSDRSIRRRCLKKLI